MAGRCSRNKTYIRKPLTGRFRIRQTYLKVPSHLPISGSGRVLCRLVIRKNNIKQTTILRVAMTSAKIAFGLACLDILDVTSL